MNVSPRWRRLVDELAIDARRWQNESWRVNPPALNFSAVVLLAELHGRLVNFPPCLRPAAEAVAPSFEVVEVLNLHRACEDARTRRCVA